MPDGVAQSRRSIRMQAYDYSQPGAYFVTVVTSGRECLFGKVIDGGMSTNAAGNIVRHEWENLPQHFPFLELGAFVVMPNHFHGILVIRPPVGATRPDPTLALSGKESFPLMTTDGPEGSPLQSGPRRGSLGAIIAQFKPRVTKRIWKLPGMHGRPVWQRNYYEHVIRDDKDWDRIHRYIECNPATWAEDAENPQNLA